jgi:hypothetical protein
VTNHFDKEQTMKTIVTSAAASAVLAIAGAAMAQAQAQTAAPAQAKLPLPSSTPATPPANDFKPPMIVRGQMVNSAPAELPKSYPRIDNSGGEPRLHVNKDVSLGGKVKADEVSGHVRFPIPEKKK